MINTLRIISFIAAVAAVVFFVFPIVYGVDSDGKVEEFLKTPEVREKFENAADSRISKSKDLTSPLVKQAKAFAAYLNPKQTSKNYSKGSNRSKIRNPLPVTPKFKLLVTSYCAEDPNLSLALIDEPGKGRHWVKPSDKVGHLYVDQIEDGFMIIGGGKEPFKLAIEESTVKSSSTTLSRNRNYTGVKKPTLPVSQRSTPTVSKASRPLPIKRDPDNEPDEEARNERARMLIDKLRGLQKDTVSNKASGIEDKEKAEKIEKLISQYQSTRISPEEAKKLGNLGKTLKDDKPDPNRTPSNTGKSR